MSSLRPKMSFWSQVGLGGGLSLRERINFARHLSIIIHAGLPLTEGLRLLQKQAPTRRIKKIVDQLVADVNNGQSLADGLQRYQSTFGDFFINVVRVGEASGTLSENLLYLSEELKKASDLRRKVRSAMVYPVVIFMVTVAISAFLTFYVFPKIVPMFDSLNVALPAPTRILIGIQQFFTNYGLHVLVIGIIGLAAIRIIFKKIEPVTFAFHYLILYLPVISGLAVKVNMASFTRILAVLLKSGTKIVEASTITGRAMRNLVYRNALFAIAEDVRKGAPFAHYIGSRKHLFPPLLAGMIEIGENTGNLEGNLQYLSNYYTEEVETGLHDLTTLLEPLLLLIMGGMVGFIAMSIILPIYAVTEGVK